VGKVEDFKAGCPVCGYAEAVGPAPEPFKAPPAQVQPLSPWVYVAALVALAAIIGLFFLKTK
jgi:hypothetical protein